MEWTVEHDGEYGAVFNPDEPGLYEIKVAATRDGKELGTNVMHLRVSAGDGEYFDAAMRAPLLKRIAEETGGRFFTPANARRCPKPSATAAAASRSSRSASCGTCRRC